MTRINKSNVRACNIYKDIFIVILDCNTRKFETKMRSLTESRGTTAKAYS